MDNSCFYYGTHTANGVRSGFVAPENIYSVSGGSSELKEKIFLAVSTELEEKNIYNEIIFSFDGCFGIICPDEEILIADGDLLEEKEFERSKINLDLDDLFETKFPRELLHIYRNERNKMSERCHRFLAAAQSVKSDMVRIDRSSVNMSNIISYTSKLWKKSGGKMKGSVGTETKRFVSCITPEGVELNLKAFDACERLAVIVDKTGAASTLIVDRLRRYALSSGYDVVSCICSLDGETVEHIIIPELSFGVFSSEHYHRILPKKERRTFAARFHTKDAELTKNRIAFSLKAYRSLMNEAFDSLIDMQAEEGKINCIFGGITDVTDATYEIISRI